MFYYSCLAVCTILVLSPCLALPKPSENGKLVHNSDAKLKAKRAVDLLSPVEQRVLAANVARFARGDIDLSGSDSSFSSLSSSSSESWEDDLKIVKRSIRELYADAAKKQ